MNNQSTLSFLWGGLQPSPPLQPQASTSLYSGNQNTAIYSSYQKPPQSNNQFFSHPPQEGSTAHEIFSGRIFFSSPSNRSPKPQNSININHNIERANVAFQNNFEWRISV